MTEKSYIFFSGLALFLMVMPAALSAQTRIVAHRGYWKQNGAPQNSLQSLKNAIQAGFYGSEFDVLVTSDGIPVVHHDDKINGLLIEDTPYARLKELTLSNGEKLPTLGKYLETAKNTPGNTRLILEIKPHSTPEKESVAVNLIVKMVNESGLADRTDYISFSRHILKEIVRQVPGVRTAYLDGDLSPVQLKEMGCTGLDYPYRVLEKHPHWIKEAHDLGLDVNVWTVDRPEKMKELIGQQADFITTNRPLQLQALLDNR